MKKTRQNLKPRGKSGESTIKTENTTVSLLKEKSIYSVEDNYESLELYFSAAMPKKLPRSFYQNADVVEIAQKLLNKLIWTQVADPTNAGKKVLTCGRILETEAYKAPEDKASHAYAYRKTERNSVMYKSGGVAYVYKCYGIHAMFNVVTSVADVPHAVLLRSIEPVVGVQHMLKRRATSGFSKKNQELPSQLDKKLMKLRRFGKQPEVEDLSPLISSKPSKTLVHTPKNQSRSRSAKHSALGQTKNDVILEMPQRLTCKKLNSLGKGPGCLTKALGITVEHNSTDLSGSDIWITTCPTKQQLHSFFNLSFHSNLLDIGKDIVHSNTDNKAINAKSAQSLAYFEEMKWCDQTVDIAATTRVGVEYAGEDSKLLWRFYIRNHPGVSQIKKTG